MTCTQFYNYAHRKIAYKLDDFPLGSFCDWSLENIVLSVITLYLHYTFLCIISHNLHHKSNCGTFSIRGHIEIILSPNWQSFHQQKLLSITASMNITSQKFCPTINALIIIFRFVLKTFEIKNEYGICKLSNIMSHRNK